MPGSSVEPGNLHIDAEEWVWIPQEQSRPILFSALTFRGVLKVRDPPGFLNAVVSGFGASKAFGCGLMLIRRFS